VSQVRFRAMGAGEIEEYCRLVHVLDKAGLMPAQAAQEDRWG